MSRAGWALIALVAAACTGVEAAQTFSSRDEARAAPQQPPQRFAFGRPADSAKIKAWDIDVRPDGKGLPPGSGTVAQGAPVYARACASCHGADGKGGQGLAGGRLVSTDKWVDWPVNPSVGNYWPYSTTLYDFIVRAMPQNAPGSLNANDTYAVIAWILNQNELIPADAVMNATTLPKVQMPGKSHFVPDDRTGGPVVR